MERPEQLARSGPESVAAGWIGGTPSRNAHSLSAAGDMPPAGPSQTPVPTSQTDRSAARCKGKDTAEELPERLPPVASSSFGAGGVLDTVICGDNCDVIGTLPRECIDLVVTSPPYDDLRTYGGHSWDFFGVAWQLSRVLKQGGVIVWVVNDETKEGDETGTSFRQALHFKEIGLRLHDTMIWNKRAFTGVGSVQIRYGPATEYMFVFSKGKPKAFNAIKDRRNIHAGASGKAATVRLPDGSMLRKNHVAKPLGDFGIRFNVWDQSFDQSSETSGHPAAFPEGLAKDHILSWSNPGDLVLDPFAGSGTTLKAAKELNRHWLGIEINPEYLPIIHGRLSQDVLPLMGGGGGFKTSEAQRATTASPEDQSSGPHALGAVPPIGGGPPIRAPR